ncbi:MAG: hypothetical protein CBC35_01620 [Planctomycetes bacterium TMED75]|nr:MAG: hypothetical protein CBC35_01620 [Planctomycetes bacterium TMED75]
MTPLNQRYFIPSTTALSSTEEAAASAITATPSTGRTKSMFRQDDEIRLQARPEWGIGTVQKVEFVTREGAKDQRVWIRFPNVGMKTILAGAAQVEVVTRANDEEDVEHTFAAQELAHESGWLGEITKRKPEDAMTNLPPEVLDPFSSLRGRLKKTLELFRFTSDGASLIDWAVAQTGLDDPMSRFNRHELEEFFKHWARGRDEQLRSLMSEARRNREPVNDLMKSAAPGAQAALEGCHGRA